VTEGFDQMSRSVRTALVMLAFALLSACATSVKETGNERPTWIDNPGNGVSASAGMHVRGRVAQEELAILRAREEFAKRFGVSIRSAQTLSTTVSQGRASTVGSQQAQEDTQQIDVKAVVKAKWRDPDSDVLWVWLVPSDQ
jgi:hypothetical protein